MQYYLYNKHNVNLLKVIRLSEDVYFRVFQVHNLEYKLYKGKQVITQRCINPSDLSN